MAQALTIAKHGNLELFLLPALANRHGLITGATGTGKTVSLSVRLIRSKAVGVYFVTQNPLDVPDKVLGRLGNRIQHALRASTPRDQKAVAATMRANAKLDTEKVIAELGVGEALVSMLDEKGRPTVVERAYILPPASRIGASEIIECAR